MFEKAKSFYAVFTSGQAVVEAVRLKKLQISGGLIAGLLGALIALAKGFGYEIPLTDDQLLQIGGGAAALFGLLNAGATVASTDKFGLPAQSQSDSLSNLPVVEPMPAVPEPASTDVQPVGGPAGNDPLAGLDTTYIG